MVSTWLQRLTKFSRFTDEAMKDLAFMPLADEPKILEDFENTWTVENWRTLGKKEHGPVFQARGSPWCVICKDWWDNLVSGC